MVSSPLGITKGGVDQGGWCWLVFAVVEVLLDKSMMLLINKFIIESKLNDKDIKLMNCYRLTIVHIQEIHII